jgi:gliding motility-associated-like protein
MMSNKLKIKHLKSKFIITLFLLLLCSFNIFSQTLIYSDILQGGITGNGGTAAFGSGTINMPVQIPPNSTIKKAYLIAARDSLADDFTVTLNGVAYTFTNASIVTNGFLAYSSLNFNRPNSGIHILDITTNTSPTVNNYSLVIPPHPNPLKGAYTFFYLYIVFENPSLSKTALNLYINKYDVAPLISYNISNINKINNLKPVCLAIINNSACDTIQDGSYVSVNSNNIGLIGGEDFNSNLWTCVGAWSNFAHYNDTLFGLDDDTPDSLMAGTDALADIKSYVTNGDTAVDITFTYQSNFAPLTNPIRAVMLSYSTPCDTFSTTATALQDTICLGNSVQLNATGGSQYSWFGAFGGLSDTSIANPMASPPQTTTYIVTIKNDSGCIKTEHVKIWVTQPIDSITTTPTICGSATGSITAHFNTNANYNFTLYDNNFNLLSSNNSGMFNQLAEGTYIVENFLNNCAFYDTVAVGYTNNVQAAFIRNPTQGKAPLTVTLTDISNNANQFIWLLPNDTFYTQHLTYTFTNGGSYPVCLVAYNNQPYCADTTCFTFVVEGNIGLIIPNVFTPNNDGHNDVFSIQIIDAELISTIEVIIYNRWGEKMYEYINNESTPELLLWDGVTSSGNKASEGTYFYVVTYATKAGETVTEKGTVSLLR